MKHVFISYSSKDIAFVQKLAKKLEKKGYQVWWDRKIVAGKRFDMAINKALNNAHCILVIWSKNSVKSDWVRNEAYEARERDILLPVSIDNIKLPVEYNTHVTLDLSKAKARVSDPALQELYNSLPAYSNKRRDRLAKKKKLKKKRRLSGALDGRKFAITGTLSQNRKIYEEKLSVVGGSLSESVSKHTDYLILGTKPGVVKLEKAKEWQVPTLKPAAFNKMLNKAYKRTLVRKKIAFSGVTPHLEKILIKSIKKVKAAPQERPNADTDLLILGNKPTKSSLKLAERYEIKEIDVELWLEIVNSIEYKIRLPMGLSLFPSFKSSFLLKEA